MGSLKDKLYFYFAEKNWGVRREYGPYVDAHKEEHRTHRVKHWWLLIRLNWHYRVLRKKTYLLPHPVVTHPVVNSVNTPAKPAPSNKKTAPVNPDPTYILPELLIESLHRKRYDILVTAFRPKTAQGGGGAVCATSEKMLGGSYNNWRLSYHYLVDIPYPKQLLDSINGYQWILSVNFKAAYYVQKKIRELAECNRDKDVFFVCHDLGTAYGAYLCGKKYVLVYHQQGSLKNEAIGAGVELNDEEIALLGKMEKVVMENAQTVYFPSNGAKNEYISTCDYECVNINFGEPLYNTIPPKTTHVNHDDIAKDFGLDKLDRDNYQIFLTVGDYNSNKGIDRIPEFLNEYSKHTNKKIYWIVAGNKHKSGTYEQLMIDKNKWNFESVILGSRISHEVILDLMEMCDFYLMLHRKSIFDLATLEAMRAGLVPVLSNVGGNPEFNQSDNVILVDMDNIDGAIEHICSVDLEQMSQLNKDTFNNCFSDKQFVDTYKRMIDKEMTILEAENRVHSAVNEHELSEYKNRFDGETVVICGGGSSLHGYEPIPNAKHIALNRTLFYDKIKFDYLFMQDFPENDSEHDIDDYNNYPCDKFYGIITNPHFSHMGFGDYHFNNVGNNIVRYELSPLVFDKTRDQYEFELDKYCLSDAQSVLFSALQFSVYAGFKKIYLIGVDFSDFNYDKISNKSTYSKNVVGNILAFKHQLRLYDDSIDLNVINTNNKVIEDGLGHYDDVITVTGIFTENYRSVVDIQKKYCKDNYRFDYRFITDEEWAKAKTSNEFAFYGGNTIKTQMVIDKIKQYWGQLLLVCDADVVFLKHTEDKLRELLGDQDMLFLRERGDDNNPFEKTPLNINIGFVLMRCNEKALHYWEIVQERTKSKHGWDQEEANLVLIDEPDIISWSLLPKVFLNGGDINKSNVRQQFICTGCGTVAKRNKMEKDEYLNQIRLMAIGKRNTWFDGKPIE